MGQKKREGGGGVTENSLDVTQEKHMNWHRASDIFFYIGRSGCNPISCSRFTTDAITSGFTYDKFKRVTVLGLQFSQQNAIYISFH